MTNLTIRPAVAADVETVIQLLSDAKLSVPGVAEHFDSFLVAERDQTIVGAIGLEPRGADALLRSAVVAPAERGSGIGRELYMRIAELARARGIARLYLLTTTAAEYWTRFGFA